MNIFYRYLCEPALTLGLYPIVCKENMVINLGSNVPVPNFPAQWHQGVF